MGEDATLSTDAMPRSRSASREFVHEISALLSEPVDYPAGFLPRRYPDTPPVMLNSVQHPWRTINRSQAASVAPWSLSQVQDDEREERRGDRQAGQSTGAPSAVSAAARSASRRRQRRAARLAPSTKPPGASRMTAARPTRFQVLRSIGLALAGDAERQLAGRAGVPESRCKEGMVEPRGIEPLTSTLPV